MELFYESNQYKFIIEEDVGIGFYLYIYDKRSGKCIKDYLQDTLSFILEQAEHEYNIPRSKWKKKN